MPLAGAALLALWNDIRREREAEYDRWHTREHVPERVAVSGMLGARRYVNRGARRRTATSRSTSSRVSTCSTARSIATWSIIRRRGPRRCGPTSRTSCACPCRVSSSHGDGIGAAIAVLCVVAGDASSPAVDVIGARRCRCGPHAHGAASDGAATWQRDTAAARRRARFDTLVLVETLDRGAAERVLDDMRRRGSVSTGVTDFGADGVRPRLRVSRSRRRRPRAPSPRPQWGRAT